MIKANVGLKLGLGFGLALAILATIGTVAYRSTVLLTETAKSVAHTHQVLQKLESVLSVIKDGETGQRGYLLTGEDKYLDPYNRAHKLIDDELKDLRGLTKDNANQQRRLDFLEPLANGKESKFAELQETIDARKDPARGLDAGFERP